VPLFVPLLRRQSHATKFAKVSDGRKQPIRGLWVRNGPFYARLNVETLSRGSKKPPRSVTEQRRRARSNRAASCGGIETSANAPCRQHTPHLGAHSEVLHLRSSVSGICQQWAGSQKARHGGKGKGDP
jgi:hypothetical protein